MRRGTGSSRPVTRVGVRRRKRASALPVPVVTIPQWTIGGRTIQKRWITAGALVLALLSTSACGSTGGSGNGKPNPGPTRLVTPRQGPAPNPNPDHGPPIRNKTPGPVAGDPNPHDKREYVIFVAWTPAKEFAEIDGRIGQAETIRRFEKSGGTYSKTGSTWAGQRIVVTAAWTELSYRRLGNQGTIGQITCAIDVDGRQVSHQQTPPYGRPRGVACTAVA